MSEGETERYREKAFLGKQEHIVRHFGFITQWHVLT